MKPFEDQEFRKSSHSGYSSGGGTSCVLVANDHDTVGVRDSKDSGKATLYFTRNEWIAFVKGVKEGEFDI